MTPLDIGWGFVLITLLIGIMYALYRLNRLMLSAQDVVDLARMQADVPLAAHLTEATIRVLATLGASDMASVGATTSKQVATINMAKQGFRKIGSELAEGAGIAPIIQRFGGGRPQKEKPDGGGGGNFSLDGLLEMGVQYVKNELLGSGGGGEQSGGGGSGGW